MMLVTGEADRTCDPLSDWSDLEVNSIAGDKPRPWGTGGKSLATSCVAVPGSETDDLFGGAGASDVATFGSSDFGLTASLGTCGVKLKEDGGGGDDGDDEMSAGGVRPSQLGVCVQGLAGKKAGSKTYG